MRTDEVYDILTEADRMRKEVVLCLEGAPGIGKTESVYKWARDHDRRVVEIIASQILPNEVSGITMPVEGTHSMEVFDHARLASLEDGDILFFDELLQAAPATLSACLTLIQERRMMSGKMLPDILIVAATNPSASPELIPLSIRQRFMFVHINMDKDEWKKYMKEKHGISVTKQLMYSLSDSGTTYNVLTPRTATKLVLWYMKAENKDAVKQCIENMFDISVAKWVSECTIIRTEETQKKRIIDVVARYAEDNVTAYEIADRFEECSITEMIEVLMAHPEWDRISEELEKMEA